MTDRELLEAAAKAAGMNHLWVDEIDSVSPEWNPLEDDGDAMRLAVGLNLAVTHTRFMKIQNTPFLCN